MDLSRCRHEVTSTFLSDTGDPQMFKAVSYETARLPFRCLYLSLSELQIAATYGSFPRSVGATAARP